MASRHGFLLAIVGIGLLLAGRPAWAESLVVAEAGRSEYRIVLADDASPSTRHAAEELQRFLEEMTGAKLPIVSDRQPAGPCEILLGDSAHLRSLVGMAIDFAKLGAEGYVLRTSGRRLVIAGGKERGTMYGVYGLLEDHLGCRWFAPGVSRIPKTPRLVVGTIDETKIPALEYREPLLHDCFDGDWCARNRMNSSSGRLEAKHGGKIRFGNGFFCHTFDTLVPPKKYFAEHPEYFSLVKGKRQKDHTQLCCTNEEVIRLCTETILAAMKAQPDAFVFSVSQNDWDAHCECDKCQALAKQEESPIGPVLALVNRVAEAAGKQFPGKAVETLAYQWTRHPPRSMRPLPNVIIRLCPIECCFSHPLSTCPHPSNRSFCEDLVGWAKICNRLWIWDYTTNFRHYLLPFPNRHTRKPNIQFLAANHVRGIFEEDTYNTPRSEMAELDGYLAAKLLWDPEYDADRAIREFLAGFYGKAAPKVDRYLKLIASRTDRADVHARIFDETNYSVVTDEMLLEADTLWQQAEELVAKEPEVLTRVKRSRMTCDFAIVERASKFHLRQSPLAALAIVRCQPFLDTLAASGVTRLGEGGPALDIAQYRKRLAVLLGMKP